MNRRMGGPQGSEKRDTNITSSKKKKEKIIAVCGGKERCWVGRERDDPIAPYLPYNIQNPHQPRSSRGTTKRKSLQ